MLKFSIMSKERNWYLGGRSYSLVLTPEQKVFTIDWVEKVKGGVPSQSEQSLLAEKGHIREYWLINQRYLFIHTDLDKSSQTPRIQLICGTHHARELKKAGLLKV